MSRKIRSYESADLIVDFDAKRCIHAEECVHGLPGVFDATRRPWIDPNQASSGDLIKVIEKCPTGALHYRWQSEGLTDGKTEIGAEENKMRIDPNGPLYVAGRFRITLPDGDTIDETRAALCRCGLSKSKPFCDNSHIEGEFLDEGALTENRLKPLGAAEGPVLEMTLAPNGPVLVKGPVEITGQGGAVVEGSGGALCRCGGSASKPFCDGAHKAIGFEAD